MSVPTATVVVATRERPEALATCLASLGRQTCDDFEVVVVDDAGEGSLRDVVADSVVADRTRLLRRERRGGPGAARNTGVSVARGSLLLFIDDDCVADPAWVQAMLAGHRRWPDALVGGHVALGLPDNPFSTASQTLQDYLYRFFNPDPHDARFFTTNNMAVPRAGFEEVGRFDETIPVRTTEDRELCDRWHHRGRPLRYLPDAVVFHAHPLGAPSLWGQHFGYGRGAVYFRRRRHARGQGRLEVPRLRFYGGLLAYPFRARDSALDAARLSALLVLTQVALVAGFLAELLWFRSWRESGAPDSPVEDVTT